MSKKLLTLNYKGFANYMARLDELAGNKGMNRGVDAALKESKKYVNNQISEAIENKNLPAHGKYSKGDTRKSLDKNFKIEWDGTCAEIKVGFIFEKSGMSSIMLMYGTPRMEPANGLYDAIYGSKISRKIKKIQSEAIAKVISRVMKKR